MVSKSPHENGGHASATMMAAAPRFADCPWARALRGDDGCCFSWLTVPGRVACCCADGDREYNVLQMHVVPRLASVFAPAAAPAQASQPSYASIAAAAGLPLFPAAPPSLAS